MVKWTLLILAAAAVVLAANTERTLAAEKPDEAVKREQDRFQGAWRLICVKELLAPDEVAQRKDNQWVTGPGLEAAFRHQVRNVTFTFKDNQLTIQKPDGVPKHLVYWFAKCSFKIDQTLTPKGIDLTPADDNLPEEARRTFGAIYLLDGNELWICDHEGNVARPPEL